MSVDWCISVPDNRGQLRRSLNNVRRQENKQFLLGGGLRRSA